MRVLTELGWLELAGKAMVVALYAGILGGFVVTFLRDRRPA